MTKKIFKKLFLNFLIIFFTFSGLYLYLQRISNKKDIKDEGFGKESYATFFHTKKESKKYHIDYIYSKNLNPLKLKVGSYAEWISYSDHSPLIAELG